MPRGKHLPRVELNCAICGKLFSRVGSDTDRRHCSLTCAREGTRRHPRRTYVCERCGRTGVQTCHRTARQRFCSASCARRSFNDAKRAENRAMNIWCDQREAKAELIRTAGCCEWCGWNDVPEVLEIHHADRNRRNNHRSNLKLLCPTCHTLHHYREGTGQFANNVGRIAGGSMPLTSKGEKILENMKERYSSPEKAEEVFYASANKGTITGVHDDKSETSPALDGLDAVDQATTISTGGFDAVLNYGGGYKVELTVQENAEDPPFPKDVSGLT